MTSSSGGAVFKVATVRMGEGGEVHHFGAFAAGGGSFAAGETVTQVVDGTTRLLFSRMHTAGHLVDVAMEGAGQTLLAGKGYHFEKGAYVEYVGGPPAAERPALLARQIPHW